MNQKKEWSFMKHDLEIELERLKELIDFVN